MSSQAEKEAVPPAAPAEAVREEDIDVDLTTLSSTMVYSEVYQMLTTPDAYLGKTVRMGGAFALSCAQTDADGQPDPAFPIYYACIIADATACCSQGLEFVLAGDHQYPDDYPDPGSEITVTGTFETYTEDGNLYCRLRDATMEC